MPYNTRIYLCSLCPEHLFELVDLARVQDHPAPIAVALASLAATELERRCIEEGGRLPPLEAQSLRIPSMTAEGWDASLGFCIAMERSIECPRYARVMEQLTAALVVEAKEMFRIRDGMLQQAASR